MDKQISSQSEYGIHLQARMPKLGNEAADKYKRGICGKYTNNEEALVQIETEN